MKQRIIDLLAMSRFANLPTVWSNVFLGIIILAYESSSTPDLALWLSFSIPISFLYLGGCFLNDWHDREFDAKAGRDRGIPSGRWKAGQVLALASGLMLAGVVGLFLIGTTSGLFSLALLLCILLYTKFHKTHAFSLLFMAGARITIYPVVLGGLTHLSAVLAIGNLGFYILGISLTARHESHAVSAQKMNAGLKYLFAPLIFSFLTYAPSIQAPEILGILILGGLLLLIRKSLQTTKDIGAFVSRSLALIPMVDLLLVSSLVGFAPWLIACPLLSLMAFALQKIAPAT